MVPFGGARDATVQQLQERQRKVRERPVGSLNDRSIFLGGSKNANQMVILREISDFNNSA